MSPFPNPREDVRPPGRGTAWIGTLLGVGCSAVIFLAIAHFERGASDAASPPDILDLKAVAVAEPPPPPPEVRREPAVMPEMATGIEAAPSESPVHLAAPPDLSALVAPPPLAPPARIEVGRLYTDFRPKFDTTGFQDRIYQMADVDQLPKAIHRVSPVIPTEVRHRAATMRTTVLFVVDANGDVRNVRVANTSGDDEFDTLIADAIKEWTFSPAIRRGKKVRCLVQQVTIIKVAGGAMFSL